MANKKPKTIQIDTYTAGVFGRTEGYANKVRQLYADAVSELLKLSAKYNLEEGDVFDFDKMPKKMREEAHKILRALYSAVYNEVQHGIMAEWQYANLSSDIIIKRVFGDKFAKNEQNHFARWFARNNEAMDAFLSRKENGFSLSQRIWKQTEQLKDEMALALSVSLGQGDSAATVSRKVRQYLQEPDRLFRHVRGADGKLRWSKAARAYHPGRGVYRSSYKNAMRLTRTETNMAYRTADTDRWQRLDFVLGQHIGRGHNKDNEPDICDKLAGDYPKEFKFTGWHPQCRCISTPILATPAEMAAMRKAIKEGKDPMSVLSPDRRVTEPPKAFTDWVSENRERIENASSVPYFIKDNFKDGDIDKGWRWEKSEEEKQAELEAYTKQVKHQELVTKMGNNVYNVATEYPEVDTSELVSAINASDYTAIEDQAKAVAHQISAINKKIAGMKDLIEDPKMWMLAYDFTSDEMLATHKAIADKIQEFKDKFAKGVSGYATEEEYIQMKLHHEINYITNNQSVLASKYNTWMVSQDAYINLKKAYDIKVEWIKLKQQAVEYSTKFASPFMKKLDKLSDAVFFDDMASTKLAMQELDLWQSINDVLSEAYTFKTKSEPYLNLIADLEEAIINDDKAKANSIVALMQAKRIELAKKKAQRNRKKGNDDDRHVIFGKADFTQERQDNALWAKSKDESINLYIDEAIDTRSKATYEEWKSMHRYTVGSGYITKPLRNIEGWGFNYLGQKSDTERDVENMTNYIARARTQKDIWITRCERQDLCTAKFGLSDDFFRKIEDEIKAKDAELDTKKGYLKKRMDLERFISSSSMSDAKNIPELKDIYNEWEKAYKDGKALEQVRLSSEARNRAKDALKSIADAKKAELIKIASAKLVGIEGVDESFQSCGSQRNDEFTGTGTDNGMGRCKIKYNIYCPKGTQLTYAEPYNEYGQHDGRWSGTEKPDYARENETILQRGTKFRITKAEYVESENRWYLDVIVIEQNPREIAGFVWDATAKNHPDNGGGYGSYHVEFK